MGYLAEASRRRWPSPPRPAMPGRKY